MTKHDVRELTKAFHHLTERVIAMNQDFTKLADVMAKLEAEAGPNGAALTAANAQIADLTKQLADGQAQIDALVASGTAALVPPAAAPGA